MEDYLQLVLKTLGGLRRDIDLVLYDNESGRSNYDYISDDEYWNRLVKFIPRATKAVVDIKKLYSSHLSEEVDR